MRKLWMPVIALAMAAPAAGQQMDHGNMHPTAGVRGLYNTVKGYITKAAEQMPEEHYSFKPTPEVRSFGQLVGHIANAGYMFCATAKGEESPSQQDIEKLTTKAELVAALNASFTYCDGAYEIAGMKAMEPVKLFGQDHTRLSTLEFNMGHDFEHYGNIVTYMRLKGLTPPSSQGSGN
jgi:uncharacterized damage-inducible protein DinB